MEGRKWKIDSNTVALIFSTRTWGVERQADKRLIETDADKNYLRLSKKLIDSREYDSINEYIRQTKNWLLMRSVPSFFRSGCYLLRLDAVPRVETYLADRAALLPALVDRLLAVLDERIEGARVNLGSQFNARDYPSREQLRGSFGWSYQWIAFNVPQGLPPSVYKAEMDKISNMWEESAIAITDALRTGFSKLISHAVERLTPGPDGKPKKIYDTLIGNVQDFIATFRDRNVTNDSELETLVQKAQAVLIGVDNSQVIRDNEALRQAVQAGFAEIQVQIDSMIGTAKSRQFDFDE